MISLILNLKLTMHVTLTLFGVVFRDGDRQHDIELVRVYLLDHTHPLSTSSCKTSRGLT